MHSITSLALPTAVPIGQSMVVITACVLTPAAVPMATRDSASARAAAGVLALVTQLQVGFDVVDVVEHLVPLVQRLHVDAANLLAAHRPQTGHQMPANKPATTRHDD